jgi:hypothetical protein
MEIIDASPVEYESAFPVPYHIFNSVAFSEINRAKCEKLHYLLFKEGKIRVGLIACQSHHELTSPFSAPFGGFSFSNESTGITFLESALMALEDFSSSHFCNSIKLVLPPLFYSESQLSVLLNAAIRHHYNIQSVDLNHLFKTKYFNALNPEGFMARNARKNLAISMKNNLTFHAPEKVEIETAYSVIKANREAKGFHLKMSLPDLHETSNVIRIDCFVVSHEDQAIAAAIVFHVAKGIVQVIYWGDNPEHSNLKPMNHLSYHLFKYYFEQKIRIVDIGPSSQNSVPFYGVADFKESIGCDVSLKFTLRKEINP